MCETVNRPRTRSRFGVGHVCNRRAAETDDLVRSNAKQEVALTATAEHDRLAQHRSIDDHLHLRQMSDWGQATDSESSNLGHNGRRSELEVAKPGEIRQAMPIDAIATAGHHKDDTALTVLKEQ